MVKNVVVYLSLVLASVLLVVMRTLWNFVAWLATWHSTTEELTSTSSSRETSQRVLTCTVSTREYSDVIEIQQRPGSTLSFTEQVIQSLAPSLVKAHKLGAHRVSVSYSLSQRSPSLPNEYLSVPLVEGSFSVLTEGDLQSAQVTLLSTHFCKVLEQYL